MVNSHQDQISKFRFLGFTLLILVFALTSCTSSKTASNNNGECNSNEKVEIKRHISNQVEAITRLDWEKAYSFAAQSFRDGISLAQFARIIQRQYQVIIINEGYSFELCTKADDQYTQEVYFDTKDGRYLLSYRLTKVNGKLGVVGAEIIPVIAT